MKDIPHWIGVIVVAIAAIYGIATYFNLSLPTNRDFHGVQWQQHDPGYSNHIPSNWKVIR